METPLTKEQKFEMYRAWIQYANIRIDALDKLSTKRMLTDDELEEIYRLETMNNLATEGIHALEIHQT